MSTTTYHVSSVDDLENAAIWLLKEIGDHKILLFHGQMAAGKTTFIKSISSALGVKESTSSPTFSIVNEYSGIENTIYHFDFYRLKEEQEAFDLGYEEYFYSGDYCFVEWPEKIPNLLPEDAVHVHIVVNDDRSRTISLSFE